MQGTKQNDPVPLVFFFFNVLGIFLDVCKNLYFCTVFYDAYIVGICWVVQKIHLGFP